jgi:hypothetical protein
MTKVRAITPHLIEYRLKDYSFRAEVENDRVIVKRLFNDKWIRLGTTNTVEQAEAYFLKIANEGDTPVKYESS